MLVTIGSYKGLSQDNLSDTVGDRFQIRVAGRPIKRNKYEWTGLSLPFPEQLKIQAAWFRWGRPATVLHLAK